MRDLSGRADVTLAVFDGRQDRRDRAKNRFSIPAFASLDDALAWRPDAIIISTPPDHHDTYIEAALDKGLHHFCEENIWTYDYRRVCELSNTKNLISVPSCSMHFLPVVKELRRIAREELGGLHAYQMALSTYMPGWHPDEGSDFYARKRHTAAAREMVPFELVWLNWVFGPPTHTTGSVIKAGKLDGASEDTWCLNMGIEGGGIGQLMVTQASPSDFRKGTVIGDNGWIDFDVFNGTITRHLPGIGIEDVRDMGGQIKHMEQAYKDEINLFVDVVLGRGEWPHSYRHSSIATGALAASERSALHGQRERITPEQQPEYLPAGSGTLIIADPA
jgi:predicted dehydrogenase